MYCIIKYIVQGKQARVKKRRFTPSVLHSCNVKTQICVTRPQCVKQAAGTGMICMFPRHCWLL